MKKFLTLFALGVLACISVMAVINWNSGQVQNLALGATVTTSSKQEAAAYIVDNNNGTGWQAQATTHEYTQDWALIDLGAEKTFTDIEIVWEASHCKKYSVYVSTDAIPFTPQTVEKTTGEDDADVTVIEYNAIQKEWLDSHSPVITGGDESESGYTETLTLPEACTGRYILIYADEYNNFGSQYGMYIFEVKVANIENRDTVDALAVSVEGNAAAGGEAVSVKVVPLNILGTEMDLSAISGLTLSCDNAAVTITPVENGEYSVAASEPGSYTLVASATASGNTTVTGSAILNVAFNWSGKTNIATGKVIRGRIVTEQPDPENPDITVPAPNPPVNAVDGDPDTYYQYNGIWGGGDGWLLVDLGDEYMIDAIGAYYSTNADGRCVFGYTTDASAIEEKITADGYDFRWTADLAQNDGWTFSPELSRVAGVVTTQTYQTPVVARYIVVKDADNPKGKPCVNEIYVAGTKREAPKATSIDLTLEKGGVVIGESNTVSASVVDQYGAPFDGVVNISVDGAVYADGTISCDTKGMVTVTASCGDITKEAKFFVADKEDYCMAGSTFTVSEGADDNTAALIDGGKEIDSLGENYVLAPNEEAGVHEHSLVAKLARPYDLDLIALLWEGACPADYDVYLGRTESDLQLYYSMRDMKGMENHSDRFSGNDMKDIRYIKIVTTRNATEYGIKLQDLKAYGTSNAVSVPESLEISSSGNDLLVGDEVKLSAKVIDQFGAEMTDAQVLYSCSDANAVISGDTFKANAIGKYTVTGKCGDATAVVDIDVVADENDYCLLGAVVTADPTAPVTTLSAVTDGGKELTNYGAPYQLSENESAGEHEHWVMLKLPKPYDLDLIAVIWERACPAAYNVYVGETEDNLRLLYTRYDKDEGDGVDHIDRFAGMDMKNVRFIKVETTMNATDWGLKLYDIKAYGKSDIESVPTAMELTASDNYVVTDTEVALSAKVFDQFDNEMTDAEILYSCTDAAVDLTGNIFKASAVGEYTVTATCGDLAKSVDISVVVPAADKVTPDNVVTFNQTPLQVNPFLGNTIEITENGSLVIEFDKPQSFTLLNIRWDAACPSAYTLSATYEDNTTATLLSVSDRVSVLGVFPVDKVISNSVAPASMRRIVEKGNMTGVTKLTLDITDYTNATEYSSKLLGIDGYMNGIMTSVPVFGNDMARPVDVYNLQGVKVREGVSAARALEGLPKGIYIVEGRKFVR